MKPINTGRLSGCKMIHQPTRMWANAQHDGRPANIGGALCSTPQSLADSHY